jgi:hypothetical protein
LTIDPVGTTDPLNENLDGVAPRKDVPFPLQNLADVSDAAGSVVAIDPLYVNLETVAPRKDVLLSLRPAVVLESASDVAVAVRLKPAIVVGIGVSVACWESDSIRDSVPKVALVVRAAV